MKRTGTFLGIFLIIIGVFFGLKTMGWIHFSWWRVWELWPLFLVFIGISMINMKNWVKNLLLVLILVFSLVWLSRSTHISHRYRNYDYSYIDESYDENGVKIRTDKHVVASNSDFLEIDFERSGNEAELELNAGAYQLLVSGATDNLVDLYKSGERLRTIKMDNTNSKQKAKMKLTDIGQNRVAEVRLSNDMIWDLDVNIGAADATLDLSKYKVKKLDIDGGAADIDVTLGDEYYQTRLEISMGVSDMTIRVPKNSGCELISETFIVNKDLPGFSKENGVYRTENFESAKSKVLIKVEGALANLEIVRY